MLDRQPAIITAMLSTIYDVIWHHYASQIYSVVDTRVTVTSSDTSAVSPVITTRVGLDTGSTCLHVPAGYAGISRWHHNMLVVVCRAGFRFHWGRTHEGVGRHPRQDGGGLLHRFGKLQANLQTRRIYWRPILLEVIVASMRHTEAEFQVVIGSHLAVIPSWKVAWWRGWCAFHFSRCRGWLFSVSRVTPRWTRVTHA